MQTSQSRQRQRRQRGLLRSIRLEHRQLRFESLESRRVLTSNPILTVTVEDGTGPGTLYDMIQVANAQAGEDRIVFAPEITSVRPGANLPWISSAVTIDGENRVTIDGTNAPQHGLWINGSGVQILNLTVNNFANGYGVYFFGASNSKVQNSRLGSDQAGLVAQPNDIGVMIHNSSNIIVGTDGDGINDANEGNLISGNTNHGLQISGDNSQFNVVAGNLVGFKTGGTELLSNGAWAAVVIRDGSSFNRIGTNGDGISDVLERNVATGTNTSGFYILNAWDNTISGNYAGVDVTGSFQVGTMQGGTGMSAGATRNTIGVVDDQSPGEALEGNLFAGGMFGVTAIDSTSAYNVIKGNRLGTNALGTYPIPLNIGVILESPNNLVGTDGNGKSDVLERNIIASATEWGIRINKAEASGNRVAGNYIGTDVTGTKALGNNYAGIGIFDGASSNIIGTNGDGNQDSMEGNLISGNIGHGIFIGDASSNNNIIAGNFVGTNASGTAALKNGAWSAIVLHPNSSGTRIGTNGDGVSDLAEGNLISGAAGFGIYSQADQVKISGNYIGTDITGSFAIPNTAHGIALSNGATNSIVGTDGDGSPGDSNEGNLISGNGTAGIGIDGSNTSNHRIAGNRIGTSANGLSSVSNNNGIEIVGGTQNNIIGTNGDGISDQLEGNIISGNRSHAILVASAGTTNTTIAGNLIGVDATGNSLLRNDSWTNIFLETGVTNTRIGTNGDNVSDQLERNVISGSTGNGISSRAKNTTIAGNYIGTNATGTVAIPNDSGISFFDGEQNSVIGVSGSNPESGNLISGNVNSAIVFHSNATKNHRVSGNRIGTVANGLTSLPNKNGVSLYDTSNNIIIGTNGDGIDDAIEGNLISGNLDYAVYIGASSNDNTIAGNLIGVDATGNTALRNGAWTSIFLETNATNTRIGTNGDNVSDQLERNVISGSTGNGISSRAKNTTIAGNYIGTNATGTLPVPNNTGIFLFDGEQNSIIGTDGTKANSGNLISGNADWAIIVDGPQTKNHRIAGNRIGTTADGLSALENRYSIGVWNGTSNNFIGTNSDGVGDAIEGNVISGNSEAGVVIRGAGTTNNVVAGNLIGLDATGTKRLNKTNWVNVLLDNGSTNTRIGTNGDGFNDDLERNVISGSGNTGIYITTDNNTVAGNYIGTDASGLNAIPNTNTGIYIGEGAENIIVGVNGDQSPGETNEGNLISGNPNAGIYVNGEATKTNRIAGNRIGTNASGLAAIPNGFGIMLMGKSQETIVGTNGDGFSDALERNLVSGNVNHGVYLAAESFNNRVAGNWIGVDATGTKALGNQWGVRLEHTKNNIIGTNSDSIADSDERNVISGNTLEGISIVDANAIGNHFRGNFIGTDPTGTRAVANLIGVNIANGSNGNFIGTNGDGLNDANEGNVISGNTDWGIKLENTGTSNNRISGNRIGTDTAGLAPLPNRHGMMVWAQATDNIIGTNSDGVGDALEGNLISGNNEVAVVIRGNGTNGTVLAGNRIGIDATGNAKLSNKGGVSILIDEGASGTRIGTNSDNLHDALERNVISGSAGSGIGVRTNGTTIAGNYIGTNSDGTAPIPNIIGIHLSQGASNNIIGSIGTATSSMNVISGNTDWGILLENTGTSNNRISGNLIGTSINRFTPLPNGNGIGILSGASNNTIGSNSDGTNDSLEGNIISGNSSNGIYIRDENTTGNKVLGNRIGLDERYIPDGAVSWYRAEGNINDFYNRNNGSSFNGTYTQGKVGQAFRFNGGQAVIIPYHASLMPGYNSFSAELWVKTTNPNRTALLDQYECGGHCGPGSSPTWRLGIAEGKAAVFLRDIHNDQFSQYFLGTSTVADGNYHHLAMVRDVENKKLNLYVDGSLEASQPLIVLGYVGDGDGDHDPITIGYHRPPDAAPSDALYFTGEIDEPTIYSKALSASDVAAIYQMGSGGKKFTQALPNGDNGILIENAPNQQIGGTSPAARNTIVGNSTPNSAAIRITGSTASNNRVQGNWIGTDESGNVALGGATGVVIDNATNNFIGTDGDGTSDGAEGNLISGINGPGIILTGSLASNNSVAANTIGTAQDKVSPLPNSGPAILVTNQATSSRIGGPNPEFGNQISFNPTGIRIEVPAENLHTLRHNRFHQNTLIAIDVGPSGPTPNDIGDSDSVKNAPVITSLRRTNSSLIVEGFARPGTEFDLYKTLPYSNGLGQGHTFIARLFEGGLQDQDNTAGTYNASTTGNSNVGTDTTNRFRFILPLNSLQNPVATGDSVTAIAADPTSEFGISTTVVASSLSPSELGPQSLSITNNTIAELSATGTIVGFLAANGYELRPSWEYTYSLVSGAGSDDNDAFRIVDNRLVSNRIFDYETKPTYTVRIRVTDPNNRFLESAMTIAISDAKEDGSGPYITRASVSTTGVQGDKLSQNPAMSADGRYVAYTTQATNIHPQKTTSSNGVVRKDLLTGEVILVSPPSAVNARFPSISASGRYIVFGADNDFGLGDNNKAQSIFLYDAQTAKTELVTSINFVGLNGGAIADQPPYAVSADGRYVAFSNWENLSANSYRNRIYVKDMLTGISTVVTEEIDIPLYFASLSADGTHVAVSRSGGARITPGVIGYSVFNLKTGARYDIPSRTTNDTQGWQSSLSGDGRYLAYVQNWEAYLFDTLTGSNQRISGAYIPGGNVTALNISPSITLDGSTVATYSLYKIDSFIYGGIATYDVVSGVSKRYETTFSTPGTLNTVFTSSISANGAKFAIHSDIDELVPDDTNAVRDVFVVDLHRPITTISPATSSTPESTPVGTTIASLAASDMFSNTILASYALVTGEGSSSNALFEIVGNTLKLKQPLDYETKTSHSIRVRATDPQGRSFDQVLTVDVTDVPEPPLIISGTPGNDAFSVTQNNANSWTIRRGTTTLHNGPIPAGTEVQILAGDGTDTLTINGSSAVDTFTINSDSITLNATVIRHANVETRTANGLGQSDTFYINSSIQTVNGGDGADRFIMADSELTVSLVEGGIGYDTLDYSNRSTPLTHTVGSNAFTNVTRFNAIESIVATSGTDELIGQNLTTYWAITGENTVQITNVDFVGFENLTGGTGSDFFQLWNTNSKITGKILGGAGNDRLTAFNRENTWNLSAARGGSITDQITAFENIEILIGGTQADSFLVGPLAQFSSINAGAGNDTVDFSTFNAVVNLSMATQSISAVGRITSVERIIGSSRQDAITGANSPNTWEVTGASTGSINGLNFESFEILRGGSNADQFNFGTSGSISQIAAGGGADTLRAANKNNSWRITGIARGTLNTTTNFTDLEHLVGGSLDDSVEMTTTGRVTGSLTGGAGTNSLSYRNYTTAVSVNVTVGVATNVPNLAPDFQILIGGAGADNLRAFAGVPSVLIGNAGNDVLTGSTGRDILIGGLGSDTLRGGGAEDILIGGSTTHDAAPSQLANLRAEWTSDRSYSERIGNLQGTAITGTPLNNETYLRNTPTDTLLDDNAVDNLYGEDDLDWFIASLANDLLVDRIADELITDPTQS